MSIYNNIKNDVESDKIEWKDISIEEFNAFLAVTIIQGQFKDNKIALDALWQSEKSSILYKAPISLKKYKLIKKYLRFDDGAYLREIARIEFKSVTDDISQDSEDVLEEDHQEEQEISPITRTSTPEVDLDFNCDFVTTQSQTIEDGNTSMCSLQQTASFQVPISTQRITNTRTTQLRMLPSHMLRHDERPMTSQIVSQQQTPTRHITNLTTQLRLQQ
ncbi:hypothetical protein EIN_013810 [Entamoeba invadens IP1]|uniref:PiggyBac transposable element-derived protein domain-containing protein n=1 Tax=Entamoeba invadens IP1 TaxID=370355 RepID=L7FQW6_ENTIV|nr:hypothetical protein EIN_013810 [Entamoeba invadens IP1]ELP95371.1 hypothetical protein EIN_013810 [Entamoeba invadens IP1]|eukprot:XP_004262142.1 hypothetical protein EIN_013810 [Entamoeba invadens IP1]